MHGQKNLPMHPISASQNVGVGASLAVVSIGITSKDEEATIADAIRASVNQRGVDELEVLVVVAGADRTIERAEEAASKDPRVRVFVEAQPRGKPAAINTILREGRGSIIVLTDGDAMLAQGAVEAILEAFRQRDVGAATGHPVPTSAAAPFMDFVARTSHELFHRIRLTEMAKLGTVSQASGYLLGIRRELLPPLPEGRGLMDDSVISSVIRRQGYRIAYCPNALVSVHFPATVGDFLIQKRRTRRGLARRTSEGGLRARRTPLWELKQALTHSRGLIGPSARELVYVFGFAILTAASWLLAYWDRLAGRGKDDIWRAVPSTKRAFGPP